MSQDLATKLFVGDASTPGANTNFGQITIPGWCTRLSVEINLAIQGTVSVGFNGAALGLLNSGTALSAGTLYAFTISVVPGDVVVWQTSSAGALTRFLVDGYPGGL